MATDEPVLKIKNLHAGIDDTPILRGIELEIPAGEIHAIMGRNGSGKTTTANIIMGHPDFGHRWRCATRWRESIGHGTVGESKSRSFPFFPIPTSRSWLTSRKLPSKVSRRD